MWIVLDEDVAEMTPLEVAGVFSSAEDAAAYAHSRGGNLLWAEFVVGEQRE